MRINNSIKKQTLWLLSLITVCYFACFLFVFTFTKYTINTRVKNYLYSISLRFKEGIDSVLREKIASLHDFDAGMKGKERRGLMVTEKEIIETFTKYQFNRNYESLRYVDNEGNIEIYFVKGYLKEVGGGIIPDYLIKELEKCDVNCYSVIAGEENFDTFYFIYTPEYRTYESQGKKRQSFIVEYKYDTFYNIIDSIIYGEEHNNKINWLAGFEKDGKIIWSPYSKFNNAALKNTREDFYETDFGGVTYYVTQIPIPRTDWNVIAAVPKWPIIMPLMITYASVLAFIAVSVVIFIYSLRYLNKRLLKPISFLDKSTRDIVAGKFDIEYPHHVDNEMGMLIKSFKKMATDIQRFQNEIASHASLVAVGQSTAMVAHDVRKPMASMKALLISLAKIKDDPDELNKMIAAVDHNIAHTNAMLDDILDFSRDSTALNLGEINPQGLIVSAISDVFRSHVRASVRVTYDLRHSHTLKVDSERIIRVLANIIGNGIEAMNGKMENIDAELLIGTYETAKNGKMVIGIKIADNGSGIPDDILPKLFDPFFTHGKKGGTGLGLAICQRIITLHGGTIEARNRKGSQGAEFVIELPSGDGLASVNESELILNSSEFKIFREEEALRTDYGHTANASEFMRINKVRGRESYLLIVDDEPLFRETVRGLFEDLGQVKDHVKVVEADTAEKGLEMFETRAFDYAIVDIDLGKGNLNGYDFSQMILHKYPNTCVLIHSNRRKAELDKNVREIKSDKFMGFLSKPMRAEELLQFLACKSFEVPSNPRTIEPLNKKKVLIVNDDDALLFSFKVMLRAPDVQVLLASNVSTALKHIAEQKVDLILSDVNLGEGEPDGYELLKSVREINKSVPFYMVSGFSETDEGPKAKGLGANGYLQIPVERAQLKELL